jgi:RND family efflux transporter MFP subunit
MSSRRLLFVCVSALVPALVCAGISGAQSPAGGDGSIFSYLKGIFSSKPQPKPIPPPIKVGAVKVDRGPIEQKLEVSGVLTFNANTTVSSEVSAQVKSIEVEDGRPVTESQEMLVFDEMKIRETANQALANLQKNDALLAFQRSEWEKNFELMKSKAISQTQFEQKLSAFQNAQAQVEADRAALAKANQDLLKTRVQAPITGLIANRFVERGDWVSEGTKLFQISDAARVYLEAFLSDIDVGRLNAPRILNEGVDVEVTVDSYPGRTFPGKLSYIQPIANQGRLFQIRIYLDNPDFTLLQGMFARGRILVRTIPNVVRIPLSSLLDQVRTQDMNTVVVVDKDNKALPKRIKIGAIDAKYAEALEGIEVGESVVTQGKEVLTPGQRLEPTLESAAGVPASQ